MAKKKPNVLLVLGSPRKKSNSSMLAEQIAEGALAAGAEINALTLQSYDIAPCNACEACHSKKSKGCVIKDGMREIYPLVKKADAFVFASPIYWFGYSAQLKLFVDRCYALFDVGTFHSPFYGKPYALAFSYGADDPLEAGAGNAIRTFQEGFSDFLKARLVGSVYASAMEPGEVKKNKKALSKAYELGGKLLEEKRT
jgi:multimeric flavodoxin WrbA